jgi:hypothetical protein
MKQLRYRPAAIAFAIGLIVTASVAARAGEIIDRVLATVGMRIVTLSDVRAVIRFGLATPPPGADPVASVLVVLIDRVLMLEEVDRYSSPEPPDSLIQPRLAAMRARFSTQADFDAALAETGMNDARLRQRVRDDARIEQYIAERFSAIAQPGNEDVARYYEEHRGAFARGGRQLSLEEARDDVRRQLVEERRRALVSEWVERLRRRAEVTNLYQPGVRDAPGEPIR